MCALGFFKRLKITALGKEIQIFVGMGEECGILEACEGRPRWLVQSERGQEQREMAGEVGQSLTTRGSWACAG